MTTWSFLREVTIKSRVRGGIFKFFKMDSGSQIAPFPGAEDKDHSQRKPRGQIGGKEMGPGRPFLPWNRKRQASELPNNYAKGFDIDDDTMSQSWKARVIMDTTILLNR